MEKQIKCPVCVGHKSDPAYINLSKMIGHCFRCGSKWYGKNAAKLVAGFGQVTRHTVLMPEMPSLIDAWSDKDARHFLYSHGVSEERCSTVEYSTEQRRLFFRTWSPFPEVPSGYHTRPIWAGGSWMAFDGSTRGHCVYGAVSSNPRRIALVEGIWDSLKLGTNAIALLGTTLTKTHITWLRSFEKRPEIILFLDRDAPGVEAEDKLASTLRFYGFRTSRVPLTKEPDDYSYDDNQLVGLRERLVA